MKKIYELHLTFFIDAMIVSGGDFSMKEDRVKIETVFLADDNELSEQLLASILIRNGYKIFRFRSGTELLERLLRGAYPDLLLIGVVLPGISGIELLGRLKEAKIRVKSMLIGTSHYLGEMTNAYKFDSVDFIMKPLDFTDVVERVRLCLAQNIVSDRRTGFA